MLGFFLLLQVVTLSAGEPIVSDANDDGSFFGFTTTNVSYLYGLNWDTPFASVADRDIVTFEHYHQNQIGDLFSFVDVSNLATEGRGHPARGVDIYGEVSPRLSFDKINRRESREGLIREFFLYSGTWELGNSSSLENTNRTFGIDTNTTQFAYLHGIGVSLNLPGFQSANMNTYWRNDPELSGSTWFITCDWLTTIPVFRNHELIFKGFFDVSGGEGGLEPSFHGSPQFLLDLGNAFSIDDRKLLFGTEIDIWINEFGVRGQNDIIPQLMIQYIF